MTFYWLGQALLWQGVYEMTKAGMPIRIAESMTAMDWIVRLLIEAYRP